MKKNLRYLVAGIISTFFLATSVSAYTSISSEISMPGKASGTIARSSTVNLNTQFNTIWGSYVNVGFLTNAVNLPSEYISSNSRISNAILYESDLLNSSDVVLQYIGSFNGLRLTGFGARNLIASGAIESSGDKQGEFYLENTVQKVSGDPSTSTGSLFRFYITVD